MWTKTKLNDWNIVINVSLPGCYLIQIPPRPALRCWTATNHRLPPEMWDISTQVSPVSRLLMSCPASCWIPWEELPALLSFLPTLTSNLMSCPSSLKDTELAGQLMSPSQPYLLTDPLEVVLGALQCPRQPHNASIVYGLSLVPISMLCISGRWASCIICMQAQPSKHLRQQTLWLKKTSLKTWHPGPFSSLIFRFHMN